MKTERVFEAPELNQLTGSFLAEIVNLTILVTKAAMKPLGKLTIGRTNLVPREVGADSMELLNIITVDS